MDAEQPNRFTLRVYGILMNSRQEVLITHERIDDFAFTKFPGGGMETGEGSRDALTREFREETGITVRIGNLLHVTDTFIQSRLVPQEQVIAIYYMVHPAENTDPDSISLTERSHDFRGKTNHVSLEWMPLKALTEDLLTFETDRQALRALVSLASGPDNCKKSD